MEAEDAEDAEVGAKERVEEARANLEARHLAAPPGSRECLTETQIWTDLCRETVNPAKVEAGRGSHRLQGRARSELDVPRHEFSACAGHRFFSGEAPCT